jgi:hypothetical protein
LLRNYVPRNDELIRGSKCDLLHTFSHHSGLIQESFRGAALI